jgi:hypothetical protein
MPVQLSKMMMLRGVPPHLEIPYEGPVASAKGVSDVNTMTDVASPELLLKKGSSASYPESEIALG